MKRITAQIRHLEWFVKNRIEGVSQAQLAREAGVSTAAVCKAIKRIEKEVSNNVDRR